MFFLNSEPPFPSTCWDFPDTSTSAVAQSSAISTSVDEKSKPSIVLIIFRSTSMLKHLDKHFVLISEIYRF